MASAETLAPAPPRRVRPTSRAFRGSRNALGIGVAVAYLSIVVLLPLAALASKAFDEGWQAFWTAITLPQSVAALKLTIGSALVVALVNALFGTIVAWILVRDDFRGRGVVDTLIDLPFALPTIVAGITLLALYGPRSPIGVDIAFSRTAIVFALLFVTLPFVVRTVQPVLHELDREMEEAAASLGASHGRVFRSIVLPTIAPAILSGVALAFARAIGEYGSVVLITGNLPFKTEVSSVYIANQIESGNPTAASAVSVLLLLLALLVLLLIGAFRRWVTRHDQQ